MKQVQFNKIVAQFQNLSHDQRLQLRKEIEHCSELKEVCDLLESRIETRPYCPHCESSNFIKHGFRNNLTRYRCKSCFKTFNALTGTPLAKLRKKELWMTYSQCLLDSKTLRKAAKLSKIALGTSFKWRHRFMAISQKNETQVLSGIVEADETFFLKSQKGDRHLNRPPRKRGGKAKKRGLSKELVSVLVACDRSGHEADYITGSGPLSCLWLRNNFKQHLDDHVIFITDTAKSFTAFSQQEEIAHITINISQGQRQKGVYHIQNVNAYHSVLKNWMKRFHGIATKYLDHYLGWCNELHTRRISEPLELIKLAFELKPPLNKT
ncbi:IS1595 family transposase [Lentisphaera marina]|uniref:IS1595 family transposase n=1 Tax=Lentisphaera marina TaxID=1111041 RepID=UPI002365E1FA|nr:IS1595 family transposase [Lentisphaera marina]MDD7985400.1 IS1595 family transposase [Lentisphaera marina]